MLVGYLGKAGIVLFVATLFVPVLSCDLLLGSGNASDVEDEDDGSGGDSGGEDCVWSGLGYMVFDDISQDTVVWIVESEASLPNNTSDEELTGASGDLVFFWVEDDSDVSGTYVLDATNGPELFGITVVRGMSDDGDTVDYLASNRDALFPKNGTTQIDVERDIVSATLVVETTDENEYVFEWCYSYEDQEKCEGWYPGTYEGTPDEESNE